MEHECGKVLLIVLQRGLRQMSMLHRWPVWRRAWLPHRSGRRHTVLLPPLDIQPMEANTGLACSSRRRSRGRCSQGAWACHHRASLLLRPSPAAFLQLPRSLQVAHSIACDLLPRLLYRQSGMLLGFLGIAGQRLNV